MSSSFHRAFRSFGLRAAILPVASFPPIYRFAFAAAVLPVSLFAQSLFTQSFQSSAVINDYIGTSSGDQTKFDDLTLSGSATAFVSQSGTGRYLVSKLRLNRPDTSSSVVLSRTRDLANAGPSAVKFSFSLEFVNETAVASHFPNFSAWIGSGFSGSGNSTYPTSGFARVGFVAATYTDADHITRQGFKVHDYTTGLDLGLFAGSQSIAFFSNNSGAGINYIAPNGSLVLLPDQSYSVWVGPTEVIAESGVESSDPGPFALTDFRLMLNNGPAATVDIDNIGVVQLTSVLDPNLPFRQDFQASSNIDDYVGSPAASNLFDAKTVSGDGKAEIVDDGSAPYTTRKLRLTRPTTGSVWLSRTTDLASPGPSALRLTFSLAFPSSASSNFPSLAVWYGSGFSNAGDSSFPTTGFARIGFVPTSSLGSFSVRNYTTGTNVGSFSGTQNVTWVLNNSGDSLNYVAPDGTVAVLADQQYSMWLGRTAVISRAALEAGRSGSISLTDIKILLSNGPGGVAADLDDLTVTPLASVLDVTAAGITANTSTDEGAGIRTLLAGHPALYFPSGSYTFSGTISVPSNRVIAGAGKNLTIFDLTGRSADGTDDTPAFTIAGQHDVLLMDFAVQFRTDLSQILKNGDDARGSNVEGIKITTIADDVNGDLGSERIEVDGIKVLDRRSRTPSIAFYRSADCSARRCEVVNSMMRIWTAPVPKLESDPAMAWNVYGSGITFNNCFNAACEYNKVYQTDAHIAAMLRDPQLDDNDVDDPKYDRYFQSTSFVVSHCTNATVRFNWSRYSGLGIDANGTKVDGGEVVIEGNVLNQVFSHGLKMAHAATGHQYINNWVRYPGLSAITFSPGNANSGDSSGTVSCTADGNILIGTGKGIGEGWWVSGGGFYPDCVRFVAATNSGMFSHDDFVVNNTHYDVGTSKLGSYAGSHFVVIEEGNNTTTFEATEITESNNNTVSGYGPCFIQGEPPAGQVGKVYSFEFTAIAGDSVPGGADTSVPTLSVTGGSLPPGISLSGAVLSGVPTSSGSYSATIRAANGVGANASLAITINVGP